MEKEGEVTIVLVSVLIAAACSMSEPSPGVPSAEVAGDTICHSFAGPAVPETTQFPRPELKFCCRRVNAIGAASADNDTVSPIQIVEEAGDIVTSGSGSTEKIVVAAHPVDNV